jgi:DNA-binding response OmpR family regulator
MDRTAICKVLLVEDDACTQSVHQLVLEKLPCKVQQATTVRSAISLSGEHNYNVIILNLGLPDMTGESTYA